MGRLHLSYLDGRMYTCKYCYTHLALVDDIISKTFHCNNGKAYLFNKAVNVSLGEKAERMMTTGLHTVADLFCIACGSIVGWKYEVAPDRIQKYKEGKYILVMRKVVDFDRTNFGGGNESQAGASDADDAGY
ncbi:protein yippee-like [Nymphaea colorata]|nr:protein yippee-like [Nymphaea colorata]XP_049933996.1 protein yippee-like [Nymphaea colorata]